MKKHILLTLAIALGLLSVLLPVRQAAHAQGNTPKDFVPPVVFQAAGGWSPLAHPSGSPASRGAFVVQARGPAEKYV